MQRILAAAAVLVGLTTVAGAQPAAPRGFKRITLDHVEAVPSVLHGLARLRLFVNAIDLETAGSVMQIAGPTAWDVDAGSANKKVPYLTGLYSGASVETAIVFVVQTSYDDATLTSFKDAIKEELLTPLAETPHLQVAVVGYGSDITFDKLGPPERALGDLEAFQSEGDEVDAPELMPALDRAVKMLRKAKPLREASLRRLIVVVSDGHSEDDDDHDAVSTVAKQANKYGIRIDTIAYSPDDERRPLLALGELSKVSNGVFRWIQKKIDESSMRLPFKRLLDEYNHEYVLTMWVPIADLPAKVSVGTTIVDRELESQDVKVPPLSCGEDQAPCKAEVWCDGQRCTGRRHEEGRGIFGWLLIIVGIAVGVLVLLIGVGFVLTKRKERAGAPPKVPKPVPGTAAHTAVQAPEPAAPAPAAPVHGPHLYVVSGPQAGQRIPLHHGFTIGKAPGSNLSLAHDGFASSNHAQILMDAAGNCSLVDPGSTNGTYINGVRVTNSRLFDGMSIRCGETELRFMQQ